VGRARKLDMLVCRHSRLCAAGWSACGVVGRAMGRAWARPTSEETGGGAHSRRRTADGGQRAAEGGEWAVRRGAEAAQRGRAGRVRGVLGDW